MQQVTPIMPPRSGVHHPRSINAMPTDTARRDLFAPSPVDTGSTAEPRATAEAETAADVNAARKKKAPSLRQGGAAYGAPSAILIGEAGANLVLSKLQGWGIPTQVAMPGIAYDLIADIAGLDLLRIQVKTRSTAKGNSCAFNLTRGFYYSKAGIFNYGRDDFDLAAFVCLSIGAIFFCHDPKDYISVRRAWMQSSTIARDSFDLALQAIRRRRYADQAAWLASMNDSAQAPSVADDPAQKPVSPVLRHSTTHPVEDLMPCPVPLAGPVPSPVPTLRPAAELGQILPQSPAQKRGPVRVPAPPRVRPQKAPPPISPSQDALDAVDWDELLTMFSGDSEYDAAIPI